MLPDFVINGSRKWFHFIVLGAVASLINTLSIAALSFPLSSLNSGVGAMFSLNQLDAIIDCSCVLCVQILVVDAFIRCKIFKNPSGGVNAGS